MSGNFHPSAGDQICHPPRPRASCQAPRGGPHQPAGSGGFHPGSFLNTRRAHRQDLENLLGLNTVTDSSVQAAAVPAGPGHSVSCARRSASRLRPWASSEHNFNTPRMSTRVTAPSSLAPLLRPLSCHSGRSQILPTSTFQLSQMLCGPSDPSVLFHTPNVDG